MTWVAFAAVDNSAELSSRVPLVPVKLKDSAVANDPPEASNVAPAPICTETGPPSVRAPFRVKVPPLINTVPLSLSVEAVKSEPKVMAAPGPTLICPVEVPPPFRCRSPASTSMIPVLVIGAVT